MSLPLIRQGEEGVGDKAKKIRRRRTKKKEKTRRRRSTRRKCRKEEGMRREKGRREERNGNQGGHVVQSFKDQTLALGSGCDLRVIKSSPLWGSMLIRVCLRLSLL